MDKIVTPVSRLISATRDSPIATADSRPSDTPRIRKKRTPAKCDGKRPCSRCCYLKKTCAFIDPPKEAHQLRIEELEQEVAALKDQLRELPIAQIGSHLETHHADIGAALHNSQSGVCAPALHDLEHPATPHDTVQLAQPCSTPRTTIDHIHSNGPTSFIRLSNTLSPTDSALSNKHGKSHFEIGTITLPDCVDAGLLSLEQANQYFAVFFQGCNHYVPIFDPKHDSFHSIRERSSLLFSAICTVGCRVVTGTDTQQWHMLDFHVKRMLNYALARPDMASLETIQAFLVRSCYASERSLLVAAATRMALDLNFPDSYDAMINRSVVPATRGNTLASVDEETLVLMRKVRTWLHLFVLGHILHVDASDLPTFKFVGDSRRSRIILKNPAATELDLFLFSQVELNVIRGRIYDSLANHMDFDDETMMDAVREAKIDISIWFDDWAHIFDKHKVQSPWLSTNLRVQKCWAENMALCRVVRASGVENVDFMSPAQRSVVAMAKDALEEHLDIMIEETRLYIRNLQFAMDFVWAKCAFCYLLLLKLSILLPESKGRSSRELVAHGNILLTELSEASGGGHNGSRSNTGKQYLQLLQSGIEKFSSVTYETQDVALGATNDEGYSSRRTPGFGIQNRVELDSFIPEQFIFEWDFPGLTLFSSSATGVAWLDDILVEALNGGEDIFGWLPADVEG
ncbi:hypothetical protein M441DRAFT_68194 [Trichoderma asperellum CBS 433.97]|uniref:Transcription factor domain-containing protein n=1 Tax=Trichoderma asperellum (strain ATCC 204424 / CBS 433.97 / NBRC 101777) TaxID=1042311 RepID=A0A2T3ZCY4_TRIA4|nr:hypothetical protein M441DRAFT_68194 [Trichoderma asperellum CBS 433.97]PTB42678.1 hypothetical protein M441DRAFT_68194 [Trichoderma asperellum CBS 433.97]